MAKQTQSQRDKEKAAGEKSKTYTDADLPGSAPAPPVPSDPVADAAEAPKRAEAVAALRAVQSALDGGTNFTEFKKYFLDAKIKVDALRNSPTNAPLRDVTDAWADSVTLKIASITDQMSGSQVLSFRTKYGTDAHFLELFREMPSQGFEAFMTSYGKKKAEISADAAAQLCLLNGSEKLAAIE